MNSQTVHPQDYIKFQHVELEQIFKELMLTNHNRSMLTKNETFYHLPIWKANSIVGPSFIFF